MTENQNKRLAEIYLQRETEGRYDAFALQVIRRHSRRIGELQVDLVAYYNLHGNLTNLDAKGILGKKTKQGLERILKELCPLSSK